MSELISLALADRRLQGPESEIRVMIQGAASGAAVEVEFSPGSNSAHIDPQVFLPRGIHLLSPQSRALTVAAVWRTVLLRVAEERSWSLEWLDPLLDTLEATAFSCDIETEWMSGEKNEISVRLLGSLLDDGYLRVHFEMRGDGAEPIRLSDPFLAGSSIESFRRFVRSLKRLSHGRLQGTSAPFGPENSETGVVSVDLVSGAVVIEGGPGAMPLQQVAPGIDAVVDVNVREREPGAVFRSSFGPTNDVPRGYLDELATLMGALTNGQIWRTWLRPVPAAIVDLRVLLAASAAKVQVRMTVDKITVSISRPATSIPPFEAAAAEAARLDVTAGLKSLGARFGLGGLPPFFDD